MTPPTSHRTTTTSLVPAPPPLLLIGGGSASPRGGRPGRPGRLRRWLSTLLILAGLLAAADVGLTLLWQEPVTALIATFKRMDLNQRYTHGIPLDKASSAQLASIRNLDGRIAYLARREAKIVPFGAALGTLNLPEIGVRYPLIQGADTASLELGPGHYAYTDLPGEGGTTAIAGHRTTYLAPFHNINELKAGERLTLTMPYGRFIYVIQRLEIVPPDARWITRDVGYDRLVLSSCNPLFSAAQRIVVFARLSSVTPTGQSLFMDNA